ncbi:hemolymph lipopolysaccharide-binding protein-like [Hetaerina americana]|uniref:hemolymph lipopolysaccharide-binding protein-like n=1 Tax=Hetaerina americana TaxID=62018 RepID=UPI003A7F599F
MEFRYMLLFVLLSWCMESGNGITGNSQLRCAAQPFGLSISSKRNQTGHFITKYSVNMFANQSSSLWKLDIHTRNDKSGEFQLFNLQATVTVPPSRPEGYEYFPGIGYYKLYAEKPSNFDEALKTCSREGGHLAIINSEAEHRVLQNIFSKFPKAGASAFVGFHDQIKEGEFITIFGQPLNSTGFLKWGHSDPNNYGGNQNCGCLIRNSFLCDVGCEEKLSFFCEYDLSWVDI